jgi:hypothetical protein
MGQSRPAEYHGSPPGRVFEKRVSEVKEDNCGVKSCSTQSKVSTTGLREAWYVCGERKGQLPQPEAAQAIGSIRRNRSQDQMDYWKSAEGNEEAGGTEILPYAQSASGYCGA